jgi:polysaccharide biosynthesis protein PslG
VPRPASLLALLACALTAALAAAPAAGGAVPVRGAATHLWTAQTDAEVERELDVLAGLGANAVRVDVSWSTLEAGGKGSIDRDYVRRVDHLAAAAAARGIGLIAVLVTTPCWASSAPEELRQGCAGRWWERDVEWYPPREGDDVADVARWLTRRHGDRLTALEVWNEPDLCAHEGQCAAIPGESGEYWRTDAPGATENREAVEYARLVRAAWRGAKEGDPRVPVLAGAMSGAHPNFLRELYAEGIAAVSDGISLHPYEGVLGGVREIRAVQLEHGDPSPLWLTELGWPSCGTLAPRCVDEAGQAGLLAAAGRRLAALPEVRAAVVYNLRDKAPQPGIEERFGLLRHDFSEKPAAAAVRRAFAPRPAAALAPGWPPPPAQLGR